MEEKEKNYTDYGNEEEGEKASEQLIKSILKEEEEEKILKKL